MSVALLKMPSFATWLHFFETSYAKFSKTWFQTATEGSGVEIRKQKLACHIISLFSYEKFLPACLFLCLWTSKIKYKNVCDETCDTFLMLCSQRYPRLLNSLE